MIFIIIMVLDYGKIIIIFSLLNWVGMVCCKYMKIEIYDFFVVGNRLGCFKLFFILYYNNYFLVIFCFCELLLE